MGSREDPESLLPRLYPEPAGEPPGPDGALEERLLARYDARPARAPSRRLRARWVALAFAASGAALAVSVPTHYAIEVGKHVTFTVAGGPEEAERVAPLIAGLAREGGA